MKAVEFFNVLMIALQRLLKNNSVFVNEKTIQTRREKYEIATNPIGSFIEHAVARDCDEFDKTPKDILYNVYKRYCKENKLAVSIVTIVHIQSRIYKKELRI